MTTRREFLLTVGACAGASALAHTGVTGATSFQSASPVAGDYAHPEWLVSAQWLQEHVADESVIVIALQNADEFANGHIPGAVHIDWPELEIDDTSAASLEPWRSNIAEQFAALGVTPAHTVIGYDNDTLFAARIWWVLDQIGHADKRTLNGGYPAWTDIGGAVETGAGSPTAAGPYAVTAHEAGIATIDEVKAAVADAGVTFVDARRADEYASGHIPGAINLAFGENVTSGSPKLFKSAADLLAMYSDAGVHSDGVVIPYCTSGVRSAVTYFTLRLIGYEQVSLFTGSWNEWSSDPSLPVTTGEAP